jgi:glycosyltransferase involved in cell wall biosynthesis
MDSVDVVIATFGDKDLWDILAARAVASAENQTIQPGIIRSHEDSLAQARNYGAAQSLADWLIFLDADDELDPYYIEAMLLGTGDIRQPMTIGVTEGVEDDYPVLIAPKPGGFLVGNHLVIGSMVRRDLFDISGGFDDQLPVLEDWEFFIRAALCGGKIGVAEKAIYRVHVRQGSRNSEANGHHDYYRQIQIRYQAAWSARFGGDESSLYALRG